PEQKVLVFDGVSTEAGAGVADFMARRGSKVEVVTPDVKVADDCGGTTFPMFYRRLYAFGVIPTPNTMLDRVYEENGKMSAVLRNEYTEELEERAVDQVVSEKGWSPNDELYWKLKQESVNRGQSDPHSRFAAETQPSWRVGRANG
ncbi:N-methylproline demethylase, partial [Burkholderia cenocepacia]